QAGGGGEGAAMTPAPAKPEWDDLSASAHVWHLDPDDLPADVLERRCLAWLAPDERAHHERFGTAALRHIYVATRALCRATLSRYTDVDPAAWAFVANRNGKPSISSPLEYRELHFNLTHTDGLIAC